MVSNIWNAHGPKVKYLVAKFKSLRKKRRDHDDDIEDDDDEAEMETTFSEIIHFNSTSKVCIVERYVFWLLTS